jgi:2,4-dienoyl-CoA reductase-like NADH-dependent reductase (Old Yellow Enzyme family)/thioredoxin reductase
MQGFSALFQPGTIGTLHLKNRFIMNAMGTVLVDGEGNVTERMLDYYGARARGGVGLITTQCALVSADATPPFTWAIHSDKSIPGLTRLVECIHEQGAKVSIQLMHYGLLLIFGGFIPEGMSIKIPSITSWLIGDRTYEEIKEADIQRYVEDFAEAARRAKEAGADAVELHACHGCLVSTFLSPVTNHRTDQYGGSIENRARFARMIVERIKQRLGEDFPVVAKLNVSDDIEGGITIDEVMRQAAILEEAGANAISISSGLEYWTSLSIPCYAYPEGPMVPLAEAVKQAVEVPVISAGKITPELAEQLITGNKVDFIGMGRPLLADPELPNKLREGRLEDVCRCVYCNNCIRTEPGQGPCSVNPSLYREGKYPFPPAVSPKKVMVVGGGIAGMQAAILMAQRGHQVSLYERSNKLGGQWNIAAAQPGKEGYATFTDYLKRSLDKCGVPVTLSTEVTKEQVLNTTPDAIVVATGSVPQVLNIPGANSNHVVQANDVITGEAEAKGTVVVIGGRFIGMEVAIFLAEQGKEVSIVTLRGLGENGSKLERMTFRTLARRLIELRVPLYVHTAALEITQSSVVIGWGEEVFSLPADTVILAVGAKSDNTLAGELEGMIPEIYTIGDCASPSDAAAAVYQAARMAAKI